MNLHDLLRHPLSSWLQQSQRAMRLRFGPRLDALFEDVLLPQRLHVREGLNEGLRLQLSCLSTDAQLDVRALVGVPLEVQLVTDRGELRRWCAVLTQVRLGQGDGALTAVQLSAQDVLGVMAQRRSNRVFLDQSVLDVVRTVLDGWRSRFPALARCFDWRLLGIDAERYPRRACTLQLHQSDAAFLRGLLAREGLSWFVRPGDGDTPLQELVLFDNASRLPANAAGPLRYHCSRGTERRDSIELLTPTHTLVPGSVRLASWDHALARVDVALADAAVDQGPAGNALAAALQDARIVLPHAGNDLSDLDRLARVALERHASRAQRLHGIGSVRDLCAGEYNRIDGHPQLDAAAQANPRLCEFVMLQVQHWARSNLPKELAARAQALLDSAGGTEGWADAPPLHDAGERYVNRFTAVQRDAPLRPPWDPLLDLPAMPLMTATVVGVQGMPVWCDKLGRVKVRFHGLDPEDHAHAGGAGTNGNAGDSTWVRVNGLWSGAGFGVVFPLRAGMEVSIGFEMGDPSRPVILGCRHNTIQEPPCFDGLGALPHNHALSGIVTRELGGERQQQLRFNDTRGHLSAQLASDHAASQLNLGDLATPMRKGDTRPRGEGAELRSDAATAVRGGRGVLISSAAQPQAGGHQLAREELLGLVQALQSAVEQLAALAGTHQAGATDPARLQRLVRLLGDWDQDSNVDARATGGGAPLVAVSAAAGAAIASQDELLLGAQTHIDAVSVGHTQLSAGGQIRQRAAQGVSTFAHQGGITAVAGQGPVKLQAHDGDIDLVAAHTIRLTAGAKVVIQAPAVEVISEGAATRWGGGSLYAQARGAYVIKSATFAHSSGGDGVPAGVKAPGSDLKFDQHIVLFDAMTDLPVVQRRCRIHVEDGQVVEATTDEQGKVPVFRSSVPYARYTVELLD